MSFPRSTFLIALALAALALTAAPRGARAELIEPPIPKPLEPQEAAASQAYDAAAKLAQRKRYAEALIEAEKSLKLAPSAQRAALLGAIDLELGRTREALEALIVAVNLDAEFKLEDYVFKRLSALPPFEPSDLGIVRFQVTPAEVTCTLAASGERFGLTAAKTALGMSAGRQTIECAADGYKPAHLEVAVIPRRVVTVSLTLTAVEPVAHVDPLAPDLGEPRPPAGGSDPGAHDVHGRLERDSGSALPTVLVVSGVVVVAAGVGFHLWAMAAQDDANAALGRVDSDYDAARADYQSAVDDLNLRQGLAIGSYIVGAAAVGTGIILMLTEDKPSVSVVPMLDSHTRGAACALSF